jgi:hypothetical protein
MSEKVLPVGHFVYKSDTVTKRVGTIWPNTFKHSLGNPVFCTEETEYEMPFEEALERVRAKDGFINMNLYTPKEKREGGSRRSRDADDLL